MQIIQFDETLYEYVQDRGGIISIGNFIQMKG